MPARSIAQRRAIAIAEHNPSELYSRNKGLLDMSESDMHDFASTSEKNLPQRVDSKMPKSQMTKDARPRNYKPMRYGKRSYPK